VEEGSEGLARSKEPVPAIRINQTSPKKAWTLSDGTGYLPGGVSTPPLSPLAPGRGWTEWSHAWGGEMCLKKVLEKLNLEYPRDSDD